MNSTLSSSKAPNAESIVKVFNDVFLHSYSTRLRGGAAEPIYEPAQGNTPALVTFRADYPSSALHEVAHWCIAGAQRRTLIDYGYWYDPDGRSGQAQARFMAAEARPQALEWCFSKAACVTFRLSLDNLDAPPDPALNSAFANAVVEQANLLVLQGLPPRAKMMFEALSVVFGAHLSLSQLRFSSDDLR